MNINIHNSIKLLILNFRVNKYNGYTHRGLRNYFILTHSLSIISKAQEKKLNISIR